MHFRVKNTLKNNCYCNFKNPWNEKTNERDNCRGTKVQFISVAVSYIFLFYYLKKL
jgi:hypothetical protein